MTFEWGLFRAYLVIPTVIIDVLTGKLSAILGYLSRWLFIGIMSYGTLLIIQRKLLPYVSKLKFKVFYG